MKRKLTKNTVSGKKYKNPTFSVSPNLQSIALDDWGWIGAKFHDKNASGELGDIESTWAQTGAAVPGEPLHRPGTESTLK